ncbi:MAG: type II secretion system protein, partial [Anaerohalosphaera sp.]|nr:type II secretion system protein [Anaerohalosphaera sp.]
MTVQGNKRHKAFTLIELLVVIAIITLLLGILSPGLSALNRHAKGLKQKSQLHAIEMGLELFKKRYGGYPDSRMVADGISGNVVTGAHHLVEGVLGRDQQGYDPKSMWHTSTPAKSEATIPDLYRNDTTTAVGRTSMARRYKKFVELKATGVYTFEEIYGTEASSLHSETDWNRSPVFTDIYKVKKVTMPNGDVVKVGTPILYFKANEQSIEHKLAVAPGTATRERIYDFQDNWFITGDQDKIAGSGLKSLRDDTKDNVLTQAKFYEMIRNPHSSANLPKPYNVNTFIMMSAGW